MVLYVESRTTGQKIFKIRRFSCPTLSPNHLTLFNVSYIDRDWVRTTWSRIVTGWGDCGKEPKELARTKTETPMMK